MLDLKIHLLILFLGAVCFFPWAKGHGTYHSLIHRIDSELKAEPGNGTLWYKRAILNFEHQNWLKTLADLEKAEQLSPKQFPTGWIKGQVLYSQNKLQEGRVELDQFLANQPTHPGALVSRARLLLRRNDPSAALNDFRSALRHSLNPQPDLFQEVAVALHDANLTDEAIQILKFGLNKLGPIPSLQLKILEIELAAARHDSAFKNLDDFQKSASRPETWMMKRALIFSQLGRNDESRTAWQSLQQHISNLPEHERQSHAMNTISIQAKKALTSLNP